MNWYLIEGVIIVGVILWQGSLTYKTNAKISALRDIFLKPLFLTSHSAQITDENATQPSLVGTKGKNEVILSIKEAINTYLRNNIGAAVNFSIIKDIVEREVEVKDEEILQTVSLPLYLGLAATMIGIIFGLFSMTEFNGDGFSSEINTLIQGVKIAMFGSLSGLVCTAYLSSVAYKKAKRRVQKDTNAQLTYLQAHLLPELIKAEDTGVSGLKASLDKFGRDTVRLSEHMLSAARQTGINLELQKAVIEKVENIDVLKISERNLNLFEKMESNMHSLDRFSSYLSNIERISSQLSEFANRTSDINTIIQRIDTTLEESTALTRFLSEHLETIKNSGAAALKSVGIAESHFEQAIEALKKKTDTMIDGLYKNAGNHEATLENIYKKIEESLRSITSEYIEGFKEAYSTAIPKFEQLTVQGLADLNTNAQKNNEILEQNISLLKKSIESQQTKTNKKLEEAIDILKRKTNTKKVEKKTVEKRNPTDAKLIKNKSSESNSDDAGAAAIEDAPPYPSHIFRIWKQWLPKKGMGIFKKKKRQTNDDANSGVGL